MTSSSSDIPQPRVSLPKVWLGLIFVVIPLILPAAIPAVTPDTIDKVVLIRIRMMLLAEASIALGWVYWLYSVYRLHKELARNADSYLISPSRAAVFHLIPLFNLYWVFVWTKALSEFAWQERSIVISRKVPARFLCGALFLAQLFLLMPNETAMGTTNVTAKVSGSVIALAMTYFTGMYIFSNAKRALLAEPRLGA